MKGVNTDCIIEKAKQLNKTPYELYNYLYQDAKEGEKEYNSITFDQCTVKTTM